MLSKAPTGMEGRGWEAPSARTVLLVEDDDNTRRVLALLLELRGYEVLEAADANGGLERALDEDTSIALLISDLNLPDIPGIDLARIVSRHDGGMAMIAITSGSAELVERARDSGLFEAVLRKPIEVGELLDIVDALTS